MNDEANELIIKHFVCPCCGYRGLNYPAYEKLSGPPIPTGLAPPYHRYFGMPSYEVCPCCGFEFGNDDDPGTAEATSFEDFLAQWIADGCHWFDQKQKPENWDVNEQLNESRIIKPI